MAGLFLAHVYDEVFPSFYNRLRFFFVCVFFSGGVVCFMISSVPDPALLQGLLDWDRRPPLFALGF